ncbi:hypothetical protein [Rhodoflexus caldus]|uniref:hypothetical protein n=1 Tax=Rhodoflexus caldus TaxID=2891236 RepID=UPI00202A3084|nr:hypothetical protein [Rhodoflexus caldus]
MGTFNQLLRLAQENREVALFMAFSVFLILLMIYLLIRSIFSPRRTVQPPPAPPTYVPVAEAADRLHKMSEELPTVLRQLHQSIEEKDHAITEKRQYIESLDAQIKQLQEQISATGNAPVLSASEKSAYEQKITTLQQTMKQKARSNWWWGFGWGITLTLLVVAGIYIRIVHPEWIEALLNRNFSQ